MQRSMGLLYPKDAQSVDAFYSTCNVGWSENHLSTLQFCLLFTYGEYALAFYDVEANIIRFWARRNLLASFKANKDNIEHFYLTNVFLDSLSL